MQTLTKPQADFLVQAMRRPRVCYGPTYRVVGTLKARGLVEEAGRDPLCHAELFQPTRAGLEALVAHRRRKWGDTGSMADLLNFEEVEAALEARFPEPLKAAA